MKYYFVKGSATLAGDETELEDAIPVPKNGYMIRLTVKEGQKPMLLVKTGSGRTALRAIESDDLGDFELANIASYMLNSLDVRTFGRPARYAIAYNVSDTTVYVDMDQ